MQKLCPPLARRREGIFRLTMKVGSATYGVSFERANPREYFMSTALTVQPTTSSMTKEQSEHRNATAFQQDFAVLHDAAVGVTLCRSREPYRAIDSIKALAFAKKQPLYLWTVLNGWSKFTADGEQGAGDNTKDPNIALQRIGGLDGGATLDEGFYAFMYPHYYLKPGGSVPAMIQSIKEYCRQFSHQQNRRLILVSPPGYALPSELEEDVTILDFAPPSYAEIGQAFDEQMTDLPKERKPSLSAADRDAVLAAGAGMSNHEFETALARALVTHRRALPNVSGATLASEVMKVKIEVVKRSEVLEVMPSDINMDDVGGLDNLKEWVSERVSCFGQEAADYGIEAPKGIALIGPPGTGKSLLAKAVAALLMQPLIKFDVSRVFAGLVGASEERVRAALKMLDAMAPCVVMLDEVDKAFQTGGGGGDSGISQRVLGAILTHMQESKAPIFWVATANRTDNLPAEFLRRGRLDEVFSVSVPDAAERLEVLRIHLRKRRVNPDTVKGLDAAVARSDGFVPAEIEAAVKDAKIKAFVGKAEMTGELIADQLANMVPLSQAFADQFRNMQTWAENNARPASRSGDAKVAASPRKRIRALAAVKDSGRATNLDGDTPAA
jgi:AAA+ superfamily predicted ATPase